MKKILYILSVVSLLAVGCTKEIPVSKDYDIDAEVTMPETKLDMTALYCNLNDTESVDLQKLGEYLVAKKTNVVALIAPATIKNITEGVESDVNFVEWLNSYVASEENDFGSYHTATVNGNSLVMAALVNEKFSSENKNFNMTVEEMAQANPVLHFEVEGVNFIVTEIKDSKISVPENWQDQVAAMKNSTTPLVYDETNRNLRKAELAAILLNTINNREYKDVRNWVYCIDMNASSSIDIEKYKKVFPRVDCYDNVTPEFLAHESNYFSVTENLDATDGYFDLCRMMSKNLLDCASVQYSVYVPACLDGLRQNFIYLTNGCWNMLQNYSVDAESALGVHHYPVLLTLKSEQ